MSDAQDDSRPAPATAKPKAVPKVLPAGYRQGIITAITVLMGFSLAFWRFWGLEAPGRWTVRSMFPAVALLVAVCLQIVALFRALRIEDDEVPEYRKTVRWFLASVIALFVGLIGAIFDAAVGD